MEVRRKPSSRSEIGQTIASNEANGAVEQQGGCEEGGDESDDDDDDAQKLVNALEYSTSDEDSNCVIEEEDEEEEIGGREISVDHQRQAHPIHESPTRYGATVARPTRPPKRRLSTFESTDGGMDLESDVIGGSARSFSVSVGSLRRQYHGPGNERGRTN